MWPTLAILALFAFSIFCIVRAVKMMRMSPEERERERAKYKARAVDFEEDEDERVPYFSAEDWEDELVTIWEGNITIEFSYKKSGEPKERRTIDLVEVQLSDNGQMYLHGICKKREDFRHFRLDRIKTQIKVGDSRYATSEFLHSVLGIGG